jgi:hypothetical protein
MKYKIKLQKGDYCRRDMGEEKYLDAVYRFIKDGCEYDEFIGDYSSLTFFGWGKVGLLHSGFEFDGRELTYDQIMELAEPEVEQKQVSNEWFEKGDKPPIHENIEWCSKRGVRWVKSRVVDYTEYEICLLHHSDQSYKPHRMEVFNFTDINIRSFKSERDRAIEAALKAITTRFNNIEIIKSYLGEVYEAGLLRLPEEKK